MYNSDVKAKRRKANGAEARADALSRQTRAYCALVTATILRTVWALGLQNHVPAVFVVDHKWRYVP